MIGVVSSPVLLFPCLLCHGVCLTSASSGIRSGESSGADFYEGEKIWMCV
jgi:hypothetical protein